MTAQFRAGRTGARKSRRRSRALVSALTDPRIPYLQDRLVSWGAAHGRNFYWRSPNPTPYSILVAESLLAKTRADLVEPIARKLLLRYQHPRKLAAARTSDLQRLLRPLGLHRKRAKQLILCARTIVRDFRGDVPSSVGELTALPSIGRYAANAIALVAFDQNTAVVDANVVRVLRRVFSLPKPPARLSTAHDFWALANRLLPAASPKAFTWALLDLGGTVCTPRSPRCDACPLIKDCNFAKGSPVSRK